MMLVVGSDGAWKTRLASGRVSVPPSTTVYVSDWRAWKCTPDLLTLTGDDVTVIGLRCALPTRPPDDVQATFTARGTHVQLALNRPGWTLISPTSLPLVTPSPLGALRPHLAPRVFTPRTSFTALEVARVYDFPAGSGSGTTVAIVQLGGGFRTSDIQRYYSQVLLGSGLRPPRVTVRSVMGARNNPSDAYGSLEVALDMQIAGAIAPGAHLIIIFGPNSFPGFCAAVALATSLAPTVSISWGAPEVFWPPVFRTRMNNILGAAFSRGVNVFVASGDAGSANGVTRVATDTNADFPASSPWVVACGGTTLVSDGISIASEVVWNDGPGQAAGGGAFSAVFPKLDHTGAVVPGDMRGVPDVCGVADPDTGFRVVHNGQVVVVGGTSAVAPLYAGLAARMQLRRALAPHLYANPSAIVDITSGSNGAFRAVAGWDAASGLGRIHGTALQTAMQRDN